MKETVKVHEKHELKVRFRENLILRIAKMIKSRENEKNQSRNFKIWQKFAKSRNLIHLEISSLNSFMMETVVI